MSLSGLNNIYYEGVYSTGKMPVFAPAKETTITTISNTSIDTILTLIFGDSPIYNANNPLIYVPWTYIIIAIISMILLLSFGRLNAFIGGLSVGFFLVVAGIFITGIGVLYSNYVWWNGPTLSVIGAFIIILSIVGLVGGVESR
jgi:hypothetical protein